MMLRIYNSSDCESSAELFYQTVHNVNTKDDCMYKKIIKGKGSLLPSAIS